MQRCGADVEKTCFMTMSSKVWKITQGSVITQAKFEKITLPAGGFG